MPRGVPARGFRLTRARIEAGWTPSHIGAPVAPISQSIHHTPSPAMTAMLRREDLSPPIILKSDESDHEIRARIENRFRILVKIIRSAAHGISRAVIVAGAPGMGKSHTVEDVLRSANEVTGIQYNISHGYVRATGLFKMLWEYRFPKNVLVFDDADGVFADDVTLNILKAVCDTTQVRTVSWLSEANLFDESGVRIPKTFEFQGTIIFITNLNFDYIIGQKHRLTPHLEALMSRAHYIEMGLSTLRDRYIRVKSVIERGLLDRYDPSPKSRHDILEFMEDHLPLLREVSLRMAIKLADLQSTDPNGWREQALVTCCPTTQAPR